MNGVNNLNDIPNFGHGMPEDGIVQAGITDVSQATTEGITIETEVIPEESTETLEATTAEVELPANE